MKKLEVSEEEIILLKNSEKIKKLVENQVDRAKQFYDLAITSLPMEDKKSQKISLIMGNIYFVLLNEIEKDNPEKILNQKTILPGFRKLKIATLTMLGFSWIRIKLNNRLNIVNVLTASIKRCERLSTGNMVNTINFLFSLICFRNYCFCKS